MMITLTNEELIAQADHYCNRLSYYYAGWDYPESAARERAAQRRTEEEFRPIAAELKARGLKPSKPGLLTGTGWWE